MSRTQWLLAACGGLAAVNAVRQALFATAPVSPRLAVLSGGVALLGVAAFTLLRRRHGWAAPVLVAFGVSVPLATVLGTEQLLAGSVPFTSRLPGYIAAAVVGLLSARGGIRELERGRLEHLASTSPGHLPPPSAERVVPSRQRDQVMRERGSD